MNETAPGQLTIPNDWDRRGLPGWTYHSDALFALERSEVFLKQWQIVGHVNDIPAPGDWLAFDLLGERAVVMRGQDKVVRAFHNLCRHRGARVVDGLAGQLGHHAARLHAAGQHVAMVAIGGDALVAFLGRGLHADDDGFLPDVKMAEATDQAHAVKLAGLFLESPDQKHVAVILEKLVLGHVWLVLLGCRLSDHAGLLLGAEIVHR